MAITVGSVSVDVVPTTAGITQKLRNALIPAATDAGKDAGEAAGRAFGPAMQSKIGDIGLSIGEQIGKQIAGRIKDAISDALKQGVSAGSKKAMPAATKAGDESGGAFARAVKARLEVAFRSLPKINVGADTSEADADLQALRVRMETLASQNIGIDIDAGEAQAEIAAIQAELTRLAAAHPDVTIRADAKAAQAQLAAVRAEIDRISATPGTIHLETDGAFGQKLRAQVEAAEKSLPNINITADTSQPEAELASLRAQLTALKDQRVGIDIDAGTAQAKVADIQARLQRLSASRADIAVRVDAAAAMAHLAEVQAAVTALDGQSININTAPAAASMFQLAVAFAVLTAIPAVPVITAGLGAITSAAAAAGVGVGALAAVAVPAFKDIGAALKAQKAAQTAASAATASGGQAAAQAAAKSLQLAGAQQALASAERNGARQIAQAQQQVVTAKQAVTTAVEQAAQRQQQAERAVVTAEKNLQQAQKAETAAQQALTDARKTAAQQLQDLNNQLTDSQLSQRDAALQVQEAQQNLQATTKVGSGATLLQQKEAQLAYDQAVQHLKEQTTQTQRLQVQTKAANKAGVTGSTTYKQAQQALSQAQQQVADKTQALADARQAQAQTEKSNARQIAQAQQQVANATANVAQAQASAADSIASAQRQIQQAQLSAASSTNQAATAQNAYRKALAKLTPAARTTLNAYTGLKKAFSGWSRSLQPKVMPLFTRAINGMAHSLSGLTPFVNAAVGGIGKLEDKISHGMKTPWWASLKKDLAGSIEPAIVGLGAMFGNIFVGMAGIVDAFLPHMNSIAASMARITGRFANWGKNLKGSPAFEHFLAYASKTAPVVAHMLGTLFSAFLHLGVALAPLSGTATSFIVALSTGISKIPTKVLTVLGVVIGSIALGAKVASLAMKAWAVAQGIAASVTALLTTETEGLDAAMNANPIGLLITLIAALVVGLIYAYQHSATFRAIVQGAWQGIQAAASFAWQKVLQPTFHAFTVALHAVGTAATWLWTTVLSPVFSFIGTAARILATIIVVAVVAPIVLAFKAFAAIGQWLWTKVLGPVFGWIGAKAVWLWTNAIKPQFAAIRAGFTAVGSAASWLWTNAIRPFFGFIGSKANWLWKNGIKPEFDAIKSALHLVGDAASWLWKNAIQPVFGFIGSKANWLWKNALKPQFDLMKQGIKAVGNSFDDARAFIAKAWGKVEDIAKKPVRFIIDHVYNGGIVPTWNLVAKAFGAPKIKKMVTKGWAAGGVLPGYTPGRDVHRFYSPTAGGLDLSGGEAIMRPEWTRAVGPGFVNAMNHVAATSGTGGVRDAMGFKDGGIFSWIGHTAKGIGSAAWNGVKKAASWLKDGLEASARAGVKHVVDPLLAKIPGANTGFGKMIRKIPDKIVNSIFGYAKTADDKSASSIGGQIPKGQHRAIISQALAAAHVPPPGTTAQWLTGMNTLITRESGWNARAINRTDINAQLGHPSQGLAQTIPGTFNAYVPKALRSRGILDPVANVAAAIRYIVANYHNITRVQQANASLPPKGYDFGGYLQPGLNLAYNGTGKPEPVLTTGQLDALAGAATTTHTSSGLRPGQPVVLQVQDGPTLRAYVKTVADGSVSTAMTTVRRTLRNS